MYSYQEPTLLKDGLTTRILSHLQSLTRDNIGEEHPFCCFSIQNVNEGQAACCYPGQKWLGELGQIIPTADTWLFRGLCKIQRFNCYKDFFFAWKTRNYTPSKKAAFCEDILKYLNWAGKSLLMDHCHSEDGQKSDPA